MILTSFLYYYIKSSVKRQGFNYQKGVPMIQNNRYCKAKQAAVNADATRKRQRCNQRDPPRYVSSYTYHIVMLPLLRVHFFTCF